LLCLASRSRRLQLPGGRRGSYKAAWPHHGRHVLQLKFCLSRLVPSARESDSARRQQACELVSDWPGSAIETSGRSHCCRCCQAPKWTGDAYNVALSHWEVIPSSTFCRPSRDPANPCNCPRSGRQKPRRTNLGRSGHWAKHRGKAGRRSRQGRSCS
jgi:hypothetical protein